MRKLIKRYFLAIAENPIENALIIGVVLYTISLIIIVIRFGGSTYRSVDSCRAALTICVFITVFLAFINGVVTSFKTTSFGRKKNKIILVYLPNGLKIYEKPIWGKYLHQIIKLPKGWVLPSSKQVTQTNKVIVNLKVRIKKQIADFKVALNLHSLEEFKAEELGALLICSKVNEHFSSFNFSECIEKIFNNYNLQDEKTELLEKIIGDWLNTPENEIELIKKIKEKLIFPQNLFSNTSITTDVLNVEMYSTSFL